MKEISLVQIKKVGYFTDPSLIPLFSSDLIGEVFRSEDRQKQNKMKQ